MLGFPIRTPPDHSSVASSPGLIAGSNVLHRLLMPRHPPCALKCLPNKHSTNNTHNKHQPAGESADQTLHAHKDTKHYICTTTHHSPTRARAVDARVHYQHDKHQETNQPYPTNAGLGLMSQGPTVCQTNQQQPPPRFPRPHPQTDDRQYSAVMAPPEGFHRRFH